MNYEDKSIEARILATHRANLSAIPWFVRNESNTITLIAQMPDNPSIQGLIGQSLSHFGIEAKITDGLIHVDESQAVVLAKAGVKGAAFEAVGPYRYSDTFKIPTRG